jgi:AraC-like DNA-binding protein
MRNLPFSGSIPNELTLYYAGHQTCPPSHAHASVRDHFLIHCISRGKGVFTCRNDTYSLAEGDCFVLFPNTYCSYCADAVMPWQYHWFGFHGKNAENHLLQFGVTKVRPYFHTSAVSTAVNIISELEHAYHAGMQNNFRIKARLYDFFSIIYDDQERKPEKTREFYVTQAIDYLRRNYSRPTVSIGQLADYIGIDRKYLTSLFQESTGGTPKEFLNRIRFKSAVYLLEHSSLPLTAIAESCGFSDPLYFSRFFKRIAGTAPREFRKRQQSAELPLPGGEQQKKA